MVIFIAAVLIYLIVVQQDFTRRMIPNLLPVSIVGLACLRWSLSGTWLDFLYAVVVAAAALLILGVMFARGWIGGGDVKLIAATLLLIGIGKALPFLVYMSVFGGLMVPVAVLQSRFGARKGEPLSVPYGIAIAVAALWVLYPGDPFFSLGTVS